MAGGRLFPAGYGLAGPWNAEGPTRYRCASQLCARPGFNCGCGLYVRPRLEDVDCGTSNGRRDLIVGAAQVWGRYVVHGDQFFTELARYELALPVAFVKPYTVLAQRELAGVAERLGAVIVPDRESLLEVAASFGRPLQDPPPPWWERL